MFLKIKTGKEKVKAEVRLVIIDIYKKLVTDVNSLSVPGQFAVFDHEPSQYVDEYIVHDLFKPKK